MFAALVSRPMGWSLIDAFASLEEREEAARPSDETNEYESSSTHPRREPEPL